MADIKTVKVVIHERTMRSWVHQKILNEFDVIRTLKERGIPINGFSTLKDVSVGKLTIWRELDLNDEIEYHYEWVGPDIPTPQVKSSVTVEEDDEL